MPYMDPLGLIERFFVTLSGTFGFMSSVKLEISASKKLGGGAICPPYTP